MFPKSFRKVVGAVKDGLGLNKSRAECFAAFIITAIDAKSILLGDVVKRLPGAAGVFLFRNNIRKGVCFAAEIDGASVKCASVALLPHIHSAHFYVTTISSNTKAYLMQEYPSDPECDVFAPRKSWPRRRNKAGSWAIAAGLTMLTSFVPASAADVVIVGSGGAGGGDNFGGGAGAVIEVSSPPSAKHSGKGGAGNNGEGGAGRICGFADYADGQKHRRSAFSANPQVRQIREA